MQGGKQRCWLRQETKSGARQYYTRLARCTLSKDNMGTAHSGTWRMPVTATYIQLATSEIPLHLAINPFFFTARQTDFFIFSPFVLFSAFCLWRSKAFRRHAAAVTFRPELETFCKHRTKIFGRPSKQEFFRRLSSPTLSFLPLLPLRKARLT